MSNLREAAQNVLLAWTRRAPEEEMIRLMDKLSTALAESQLDRLTRIQEELGLYDDPHTALLGNLLARIHRDGGQYVAQHGYQKACLDAEAEVIEWLPGDEE